MPRVSKKKKVPVSRTHIAFVLDSSSSIQQYGLTSAVMNAFNDRINVLREQGSKLGLEIYVTLITFSDQPHLQYLNRSVQNVEPLTFSNYRPYGNTALLDGIGFAVEQLSTLPANSRDAYLVEVITDGQENHSTRYRGVSANSGWGKINLAELVRGKIEEGNWTFAYQMPNGYGATFRNHFGIPGDIREWEQTVQGTEIGTQASVQGLTGYMNARSAGKMSVDRFYVQTDLSKVKPKDVQKTLDDISDKFKVYTVSHETEVRDFVEEKTKKDYVVGSTFFQLMKPEKVQANKRVLIMEKGKKAIWGGQEARDLIGLPNGADAKVEPGNHANYDIFIESRSVNRLLPRGTKVLVDVTKKKGEKPTWNHLAASSK